ncbi:EAL domain-containing protein [Pleionea sp. CnH1-48]|uniref:EAL domain-containing protein n=1 Tax=Pleionea sp. CnH1-48 TaxID=2954494 RepID=UPI0020977BD6|nr:EAL domain-containing protein [Pleionea sp. CnH1-48]MCO7225072.1 EAL domain-containing protein [Pleionea sp. CnH1-48]
MKWNASIRSKMTIIIVGISMLTMSLGFTVVGISFYQSMRDSVQNDALSQAHRLATDSFTYLNLNYAGQAQENLLEKAVLSSPHSVAIFDGLGNLFSQVERGGGYISQSDYQKEAEIRWDDRWLHIYQPITDALDEQIGTLYLRISNKPLNDKLRSFIFTLLFLMLIMVAIAVLLARSLQKYISGPLLQLESISQQVSSVQNYALRVPIISNDEIGSLSKTFNDMLETIERRQRERDAAEEALQLNKRRLERAVKDLQYLANYDSLTQLPNRALCMDRIRYALKRAARTRTYAALMFLDLDHFKDVNDSLGHAVGDELLKAASKRLQNILREEDTLARLGGDEFVIILNEISDAEGIITVVEKIVESFNMHFDLSNYVVNSTVSVGVCTYPNDGNDVDALMKAADAAMYKAKESGRNTYAFYEAEMNELALRRHRIANDLRSAIEKGELSLVYQPQVDIARGQVIGAEALLRWTHPELGFISPGEFVPIAENTGLIKQIGRWVMETACTQVQQWREAGYTDLKVAVNLSALQFRQSDLPEMISMMLKRYRLPPNSLELELTESMLMRDVEQAIKILHRLKRMGVQIAVDDFGTGYSSLSYLRRFPLDSLKIDRTFIDEVCVDPDDTAITLAIISMAKSLRLKVIAEGVESTQQWEFLAQHNCDEIQGYLVSKGIPADEFYTFIGQFSGVGATANESSR